MNQHSYGDGSAVRGFLGQDRVNIGGLVIEDQIIGLATAQSISFSNDVIDGILGLGFNSISCMPGTLTPMDNMIKQNLIQSPIFRYNQGLLLHLYRTLDSYAWFLNNNHSQRFFRCM